MTPPLQLQVGFIGLGRMGQPMAQNVLKAGFTLGVWNRTLEKTAPLAASGAKVFSSAAALAAECEVVITMLSAPDDLKAVAFGPDGIADGIRSGSVYIDMSTVDPATSCLLAGRMASGQVEFMDAPVVGSIEPAAEGTLTILAGGLPTTFARVQPILGAMGRSIIHVGEVGMGSTFKLATNLMLAHLTVGFSEALVFLKHSGAAADRFLTVLNNAAFRSPWFESKGRRMIEGNFSTNFAWKHMQKDVQLMLDHAKGKHVRVPVTEAIGRLYREAQSADPENSERDYSAILAYLNSLVDLSSAEGILES